MTINQLNQWLTIFKNLATKDRKPVQFDNLYENAEQYGLDTLMMELENNHYIAKMKDGNIFINWHYNKYNPDATIDNLRAELNSNQPRQPSLSERVEMLEERVKLLEQALHKEDSNGME